MKEIRLQINQFNALAKSLKLISENMENVQLSVERCKSTLDMELTSKPIIEANMSAIIKKSKLINEVSSQLYKITVSAAEEFKNADKESSAKSKSMLNKFSTTFNSVISTVTGFLLGKFVMKHYSLISQFLPGGKVYNGNANIIARIKNLSNQNGAATLNPQVTETVSTSVNTETATVEIRKAYQNSFLSLKGNDYSGFNVTHNIDLGLVGNNNKPVFKQGNFSSLYITGKENKNQGCTTTAESFLATILTGTYHDPTKGWSHKGGSTWPYTTKIEGTKGLSSDAYLKKATSLLANDTPVLFRITNHTVCAIGLRNGVSADVATADDVLVMDPADGLIKTLQEACGSSRKIDSSYSLRVAKSNLK